MFGKYGESAGRQWADPKLGVSKFKKGIEKIEQHERSAAHREAEKTYFDEVPLMPGQHCDQGAHES